MWLKEGHSEKKIFSYAISRSSKVNQSQLGLLRCSYPHWLSSGQKWWEYENSLQIYAHICSQLLNLSPIGPTAYIKRFDRHEMLLYDSREHFQMIYEHVIHETTQNINIHDFNKVHLLQVNILIWFSQWIYALFSGSYRHLAYMKQFMEILRNLTILSIKCEGVSVTIFSLGQWLTMWWYLALGDLLVSGVTEVGYLVCLEGEQRSPPNIFSNVRKCA